MADPQNLTETWSRLLSILRGLEGASDWMHAWASDQSWVFAVVVALALIVGGFLVRESVATVWNIARVCTDVTVAVACGYALHYGLRSIAKIAVQLDDTEADFVPFSSAHSALSKRWAELYFVGFALVVVAGTQWWGCKYGHSNSRGGGDTGHCNHDDAGRMRRFPRGGKRSFAGNGDAASHKRARGGGDADDAQD